MNVRILAFMFFTNLTTLWAAERGEGLSDFVVNAKRYGQPLTMVLCPISGEPYTTEWAFEGKVIAARHTCGDRCYRPLQIESEKLGLLRDDSRSEFELPKTSLLLSYAEDACASALSVDLDLSVPSTLLSCLKDAPLSPLFEKISSPEAPSFFAVGETDMVYEEDK